MKYMLSSISGLISALLFILIYNYLYNPIFGVVDMDKIAIAHVQNVSKLVISGQDVESIGDEFERDLKLIINDLNDRNIILLDRNSVVSSIPDYTDHIIMELGISVNE